MRKIVVSSFLSLAAVVVVADATALPKSAPLAQVAPKKPAASGPIAPVAPAPAAGGKKIVVRPRLAAKQAERVTKNGQTKTRAEIVAMFDPAATISAGGKTTTAQELVDAWDRAEGQTQPKGGSMFKLQKRVWMKPTTEGKIAAQKLAHQRDLQLGPVKPRLTPAGVNMCDLRGCVPADKEEKIDWRKQLGDEDIAAAYTQFTAVEKTPDVNNASCELAWDNGVYILGEKMSVLKLQVDTKTKNGTAPSQSASASLYVLGQASPVWSKSGTITNETLDRTFKTPKKSLDYSIVPAVVTLTGSIQASATLSAKPTVQTSAMPTQAKCGFDLTPRLVANVNPEVKLTVGIPDLATLAEGGLKANLDVVDARFPTKLQMGVTSQPARIDILFKSDVNTTFMRGNLTGWYKIHDLCAFGYCLLEDGLGIDTSGEIVLWTHEGWSYNTNLVDLSGQVALQSTSSTAGVAQH